MIPVSPLPPPPGSQDLGIVHASGTDRDDPDAAYDIALKNLVDVAEKKQINAVFGVSADITFDSLQDVYVVILTGTAVILPEEPS